MSSNKSKYYVVTTTIMVKANSQADALAIANRERGFTALDGEVLAKTATAARVSAAEAKYTDHTTNFIS